MCKHIANLVTEDSAWEKQKYAKSVDTDYLRRNDCVVRLRPLWISTD